MSFTEDSGSELNFSAILPKDLTIPGRKTAAQKKAPSLEAVELLRFPSDSTTTLTPISFPLLRNSNKTSLI